MEKLGELVLLVRDPLASLDDERDFFRPMEYFLVIGGIHLRAKNLAYRFLFFCYRIMLAIQFFVWADRIYVASFEWNSPVDLIGVCTFFLAVVMILIRAGLIRFYLKKLDVVCAFLGRQLNLNRTAKRDQSYRLMRRIAVVLEVAFFVDQIMFFGSGVHRDRLYSTPDNLGRLDWRVKLFFDMANASNHFVYSSLYVTIMTVLNSLLMAFEAELEKVVQGYEEIFERVDVKLQKVINRDQRLQKQPQLREVFEESLFWDILENELNSVIIKHTELVKKLDTLDGFFKMTFLVMFYMEIVVLGCATFYIIGKGLAVNSVIVASYSGTHLLECYWFCRLVDNLNDTNKQIFSAVYNLDWHQRLRWTPSISKQYRKIRTTLLMVMMKSQQNLGISCAGMFEMSQEAFQQLMKLIYTFLMFLINSTTTAPKK